MRDIGAGDRFFYFTTCGWMMWNWLVSGLASGATLLLYDGSPFYPRRHVLFDFADAEKMTYFGTSAKFIDARARRPASSRATTHRPVDACARSASTGSPLVAGGFRLTSMTTIKQDVHLASISGGTDIVSCFVLGDPTEPVWRGEIQGRGPRPGRRRVRRRRQAGRGRRRASSSARKPFPSMPIGFWNDPDGAKYHAAYFERFPGVWCHGDFAEWTEHGGIIIHGRSDATLNPGGVRIGTAEIYRQVEQMPEVLEALVIGQDWDGDVRVVLFVRLRDGAGAATRSSSKHQEQDPRRRDAAPRAGQDRRGRRHSAHQERQDRRARGARRRARPRGEEQGGARQSRSARALSRPAGFARLYFLRRRRRSRKQQNLLLDRWL